MAWKSPKRLRFGNTRTPILLLKARDVSEDIVRGLDADADDYLTKPLSFDVLLARIREPQGLPVNGGGGMVGDDVAITHGLGIGESGPRQSSRVSRTAENAAKTNGSGSQLLGIGNGLPKSGEVNL
jgi:hypothetical protein